MIKYSLVIPCFNEEKSLQILINGCKKNVEKDTEVIFVNNGSNDKSLMIFKELIPKKNPNLRYVSIKKNLGYGHGIVHGLKKCKGEFIGWTHADLQTNPLDALKNFRLFNLLKSKNIFIKGKRINRPLFDNFFSIGMSFFESILFQKIFYEINAQPTLFSKLFFKTWKHPPDDFSLDLYAYVQAKKQSLKIHRFNVYFDKRKFGESKWNTSFNNKLKFIIRTIRFSIQLRLNYDKN